MSGQQVDGARAMYDALSTEHRRLRASIANLADALERLSRIYARTADDPEAGAYHEAADEVRALLGEDPT